MRLAPTSAYVFEIAVVRQVKLQRIAAQASNSFLEQLSDNTPEKSTVTEKRLVKSTPERSPYLYEVKPGMATDIM